MKKTVLKLIRFYMRKISPLFPARCRYYPTCSDYMFQAVEKYGVIRGVWLGVRRLSRCNIIFPGGVDPLPELKTGKRKNKRRS